MTLEQIDKIISDLRNQIPPLQMQLHQAEGTTTWKDAITKIKTDNPKPE